MTQYSKYSFTLSIHTFLAEGDTLSRFSPLMSVAFQSTPSLRKVTSAPDLTARYFQFQSTPSLRKVTEVLQEKGIELIISIHTFLAEGDFQASINSNNPKISIHTFLAEGDFEYIMPWRYGKISIHTFLAEGDCKNIYN